MLPQTLAIVVTVLVMAVGCSSDESSAPTTSSALSPASDLSELHDEADAEDVDGLVSEIPDESVRSAVEDALVLARAANEPCVSPASWSEAADAAAVALSKAATKIEASESLQNWLSSPDAVAIRTNFARLLVDEPTCGGGRRSGLARVWRSAVGVLGALDRFHNAVQPANNGQPFSLFWLSSDVMGHTVEIQRLLAEGESVDVLIAGDSNAKRIDPVALGDALDLSVVNVSVNGLLPDGVSPWLRDLGALGASPDVVVMGVSPLSAIVPCGDLREQLYDSSVEWRETAFAGIGLLADIEPQRRASGGAVVASVGPLIEEYDAVFAERGRLADPSKPVGDAAIQQQVDNYSTLMSAASPCESRLEDFATQLAEFEASGVEVVVVAMPVSDKMASLHPDGRAGHDELAALYSGVAEESGVTFLNLTDLLADDEFADLSHANGAGMAKLTTALSDELARLN